MQQRKTLRDVTGATSISDAVITVLQRKNDGRRHAIHLPCAAFQQATHTLPEGVLSYSI
jgi:hypothetical protein